MICPLYAQTSISQRGLSRLGLVTANNVKEPPEDRLASDKGSQTNIIVNVHVTINAINAEGGIQASFPPLKSKLIRIVVIELMYLTSMLFLGLQQRH